MKVFILDNSCHLLAPLWKYMHSVYSSKHGTIQRAFPHFTHQYHVSFLSFLPSLPFFLEHKVHCLAGNSFFSVAGIKDTKWHPVMQNRLHHQWRSLHSLPFCWTVAFLQCPSYESHTVGQLSQPLAVKDERTEGGLIHKLPKIFL